MSEFTAWARGQLGLDGAPSLSVAVGIDDDVIFADAAGFADRAAGKSATPETAYLLASITKPITATAVCLLAEQGTIDLDEPVERYLGGVTLIRHVEAPPPTVRQVLQHRADVGMHYRFFYDYRERPVPRFDEVAARYGHVVSTPGTTLEYSNLGYGILDEAIRVTSGSDPATFVRTAVFEPLEMSSAQVGPSYERAAPVAERYAKDGAVYPDYDVDHRGASMAWSSAPDLVRFGLAHAGGHDIMSDSMVHEMQDAVPVTGSPAGYGLGWNSRDIDGTPVLSHAGGMGGVSTLLMVVPRDRIAVAAFANGTNSALPRIAVARLMHEFARSIEMPPEIWERDTDEPAPERVPAGIDGMWEGTVDTYVGDIPIRLELGRDGSGPGWLGDEGPADLALIHPGSHDLALALPLQLPTPDAMVASPTITCHLDVHDDTLRGTVRTEEDDAREPAGNCMTHWSELTRT